MVFGSYLILKDLTLTNIINKPVHNRAFALMRLDDKASDEHFIFTELNNLFNNIFSNTASTQMRERCASCLTELNLKF
jgi:hypothetical protein